MKKTILVSSVIALFAVCAAMVASAVILHKPFVRLRSADGVVVKGTSSERVISDAATWTGRIEARVSGGEAQDLKDGYAKIAAQAEIAKACLLELGAREESLEIGAPSVSPIYEYKDGRQTGGVLGYQFSAVVSYRSGDVMAVRELARSASELIRRGVEFSSGTPSYYYTRLEDAKLSLLEQASANAQERARALVGGNQVRLGGVISASQGVFQVTAPLSTETSDWGCYDTHSIEKEIKCVVTVTYAVQ